MIYLEMYGRAGNQLFRYATARAIQHKYYPNEEIVINFQQVEEEHKVDSTYINILDDFCVSEYKKYDGKDKPIKKESSFIQKLIGGVYYIGLRKFAPDQMNEQYKYQMKWHKILNWVGIYWYRTGYIPLTKSKAKNKFLSGNFESPEYFEEIKNIIKKEFRTNHELVTKNQELYSIIQSSNSICVSVRRGDFMSNDQKYEDIKKLHGICKSDYFVSAIERAKELVDNPTFIMFSDDIEWVKNNIKADVPTYYEDGTDEIWEKLRLMSMCKHFILSNSTFSWWAQYLSDNENKIVICPDRWFNNDYISPLIEKDWIKITLR